MTPAAPVTVDGVPVAELSVLIVPSAYFVSPTAGTAEVTRVYYHDGKFQVAAFTQRVGDRDVIGAHYTPEHGLLVRLSGGYHMYVPASRCQASWRT